MAGKKRTRPENDDDDEFQVSDYIRKHCEIHERDVDQSCRMKLRSRRNDAATDTNCSGFGQKLYELVTSTECGSSPIKPSLARKQRRTIPDHQGSDDDEMYTFHDGLEQGVKHSDEETEVESYNIDMDGAYPIEMKRGWLGVEQVPFCTSTRASEIELYNEMNAKCQEWNALCEKTFTEMIRCCICGVCELGCVVNSTFKFIKATPDVLINDDLPSRVCDPGLPGKYVTEEKKGEQMMKVCSYCAKDPDLGMEYCVNYNKQSGEYMEWLLASDIHEHQAMQCIDVGYQISKKNTWDTGYTGLAHGFAMFMEDRSPIIRAVGSIYEKKDDSEVLQNCDHMLYNSLVRHRFKQSSQSLLIFNLSTNKVYQHLRCMAEVPDFNRNSFLSQDIVKEILQSSRNRDPLSTRNDNHHAEQSKYIQYYLHACSTPSDHAELSKDADADDDVRYHKILSNFIPILETSQLACILK